MPVGLSVPGCYNIWRIQPFRYINICLFKFQRTVFVVEFVALEGYDETINYPYTSF